MLGVIVASVSRFALLSDLATPSFNLGEVLMADKDSDSEQLNEILSLILDQLKTNRAASAKGPARIRMWPTLKEIEGTYVGHVLRHTRGNKQQAARILDVDRKTLDRMIKRHEIMLE